MIPDNMFHVSPLSLSLAKGGGCKDENSIYTSEYRILNFIEAQPLS